MRRMPSVGRSMLWRRKSPPPVKMNSQQELENVDQNEEDAREEHTL